MGTCHHDSGASLMTWTLLRSSGNSAHCAGPTAVLPGEPFEGIALQEWDCALTPAKWKPVFLLPRMLLRHTDEKGQAGKTAFADRFKRFCRGERVALCSSKQRLLTEAASAHSRQ